MDILQRGRKKDPELALAAAEQISTLSSSPAGQIQLLRAAAIPALIEIFDAPETPEDLLLACTTVMANMGSEHDSGRQGLAPVVPRVAAMLCAKATPDPLKPQLLRLLRNVSSVGSSALGLVLSSDDGVLDAVVQCMCQNRNLAEVQVQGCSIIWNLAITDTTRAQIVAAGGGDAVQAAMSRWSTQPEVQAVGEAALRALKLTEPSKFSQSVRA